MDSPIRILLVDDHSLFRESLGRLLEAESDFQVTGSFATGSEALYSKELAEADVVLLDYDLGDEQGQVFLDTAHDHGFRGRVLLVTAGMNQSDTMRVFQSGVAGIFLKTNPPAQLILAIRQVINGATWMDDRAVKAIVAAAAAARAEHQNRARSLNERDQAILKALFEGLANKEIAAKLNISETSVKWALQQLFDKTGVRSRSQLVRFALEHGVQDW
jgi:two-component system nitrate/nitrite response regulator NarL